MAYAEPFERNKKTLGVDFFFDQSISTALKLAAQTGKLTMTKPVNLPQGPVGAIAFLPIYDNDLLASTEENKIKHVKGFVSLVVNIRNLVSRDLEGFPHKFSKFYALDKDSAEGEIEIFSSKKQDKKTLSESGQDLQGIRSPMYSEKSFEIGERNWLINVYSLDNFRALNKGVDLGLILNCLLCFSGFLTILLLILSARKNFRQIILERTQQLETELEFRKKISEDLVKSKDELVALSLTDPLTGLANRRGLEVDAQEILKLAKRYNKEMFLFFIDLDNMKLINDTLGHKEGDAVLVEVSTILKDCFRETDIIARLGGDEFCMLVNASIGEENFVIKRLQRHLDHRNANCLPHKMPISLSVGWAICDKEATSFDIEKLITQADKMMYIHKRSKKANNSPRFENPESK